MLRIGVVLVLASSAIAQQECAPCHPAQVQKHLNTHHAHALRPVRESAFFRNLPVGPIAEARDGYLFSYSADGNAVMVTAERRDGPGADRATARIDWVFGSGELAETPVATRDGRIIEHRISYYTRAGKHDLTLGHKPGHSASAESALGLAQNNATASQCFSCHGAASIPSVNASNLGITCERCHEGADQHARGGKLPVNPGKLAPFAAVDLCASCHRLEPPAGAPQDPLNIRFQPYRLVLSRCFEGGKLQCGSCHEAHSDARRNDAAHYAAKCGACHARAHLNTPRQSGDCVACHMPTSSPAPHLTFTDHFIRVIRGR
jgi:hypothetical protein